MDHHLARGRLWEAEQERAWRSCLCILFLSFFSPGEIISRWNKWKNHIRPCSLMNCLHYLIFWVTSLRETGYHLLLGINPGINSTEGGSGVYGRYVWGRSPSPTPPPPPKVPLGTFDTLSQAWLHSVAVHRRRSPKKTGGLNSLVRTLRRKTSYHF